MQVASSDPSGSVVFDTWTARDGYTHPKGGWQGGRGWQINASAINETNGNYLLAGKWMIENVWEALDERNEWFFDANAKAGPTLYLIPNTTDHTQPPPSSTHLVAVQLETLIAIKGTKETPVKNVQVSGIIFRDAADITMKPWGVPSGGDWGLYRGGAIFIEGARDIHLSNCTLTRLDGNGVFVSGYTRNVTIADNEFSWIGDSPAASWGYTKENNGLDGLQPRGTTLVRNFVREWGHYEKQSSFWCVRFFFPLRRIYLLCFVIETCVCLPMHVHVSHVPGICMPGVGFCRSENKACLSHVEANVVFNGPRAGINFNDV